VAELRFALRLAIAAGLAHLAGVVALALEGDLLFFDADALVTDEPAFALEGVGALGGRRLGAAVHALADLGGLGLALGRDVVAVVLVGAVDRVDAALRGVRAVGPTLVGGGCAGGVAGAD